MPNAVVQETWRVRAIFSHALQPRGAWFPPDAMRPLMPLTCANDQVVPELRNLLPHRWGAFAIARADPPAPRVARFSGPAAPWQPAGETRLCGLPRPPGGAL